MTLSMDKIKVDFTLKSLHWKFALKHSTEGRSFKGLNCLGEERIKEAILHYLYAKWCIFPALKKLNRSSKIPT